LQFLEGSWFDVQSLHHFIDGISVQSRSIAAIALSVCTNLGTPKETVGAQLEMRHFRHSTQIKHSR
jgi:hypothetical protein